MSRDGFLDRFAANHVAANLLMVFILAAGILSIGRINVEVFPEIDPETITVAMIYKGASPAEVEEGVCIKIEEAIEGTDGIKRIRSVAGEGSGMVVAELEQDAEVRRVLDNIKSAVDLIETFPEETEKPVVSESVFRRRAISVVLFGDVPEKTLKSLAERTRDDLTLKETISIVEFEGIRNYEIFIEVSEENLRKYSLTFAEVADAVRRASLDIPGGSVKTDGGEILIRTKGQKYLGKEFDSIVVLAAEDGTRLFLSDIANVVDGFEDSDTAFRFDGLPAVMLQVYRVGSQDVREVADTVKQYVEDMRARLPNGISIDTWQDDSLILQSRMNLLMKSARIGLILVFLSLILFLDLKLAFWVTLGIPISFLGGFFLINQLGLSINMVSLFAFIVVLGIVVDDAIVVGENIFSCRKLGMEPLEAAITGVKEMSAPVIVSVVSTMVAFAPLIFVQGTMGQIMGQIAIVVIAVLAISLVEALMILPAHLAGWKEKKPAGSVRSGFRLQEFTRNGLERFIHGPYARLLERAIAWRYSVVALAVSILVISIGYVAGGHIGFTFMPRIDSDNVVASLTMPQGTPLARTEQIVQKLENAGEELREELDAKRNPGQVSIIRHMASAVGQQPSAGGRGPAHGAEPQQAGGSNIAEVNIEFIPGADRIVSSGQLADRWRAITGEVPGAVSLMFSSNLFTAGEPVNVALAHKNFDTLLRAADELKEILYNYEGISDISDSFLSGKREVRLSLKPEGIAAGLTLSNLARQVRQGFYGEEVQRIQRGREDVRVVVRYPRERRASLQYLENMRIRLPGGLETPFRTVAEVQEGTGFASIARADNRRIVSVSANVDETIANANEINRDLKSRVLPGLIRSIPGLTYDFEGGERQQHEALSSLGINFLIAIAAIFGLLAIPLRRYSQPLIIMSAIPFGLVGAIMGHVIMGMNLTLLSLFGFVALTGVVVNDSLIMIDLINRERKTGIPIRDAIRNSGMRRFRPILLTTITTFLGLTPIILETSIQARFLMPMALSLGFGVLFATAISLLLVPVLYAILEDSKKMLLRGQRP